MYEIEFLNGQLSEDVLNVIIDIEEEAAIMAKKRDEMRSALLQAMEKSGVKKLDTPDIAITYVEETDREIFDKKELKNEMPEVYEAYADFKPVKSSIRVKLK